VNYDSVVHMRRVLLAGISVLALGAIASCADQEDQGDLMGGRVIDLSLPLEEMRALKDSIQGEWDVSADVEGWPETIYIDKGSWRAADDVSGHYSLLIGIRSTNHDVHSLSAEGRPFVYIVLTKSKANPGKSGFLRDVATVDSAVVSVPYVDPGGLRRSLEGSFSGSVLVNFGEIVDANRPNIYFSRPNK